MANSINRWAQAEVADVVEVAEVAGQRIEINRLFNGESRVEYQLS